MKNANTKLTSENKTKFSKVNHLYFFTMSQ